VSISLRPDLIRGLIRAWISCFEIGVRYTDAAERDHRQRRRIRMCYLPGLRPDDFYEPPRARPRSCELPQLSSRTVIPFKWAISPHVSKRHRSLETLKQLIAALNTENR
jgi:hypothetical protein